MNRAPITLADRIAVLDAIEALVRLHLPEHDTTADTTRRNELLDNLTADPATTRAAMSTLALLLATLARNAQDVDAEALTARLVDHHRDAWQRIVDLETRLGGPIADAPQRDRDALALEILDRADDEWHRDT